MHKSAKLVPALAMMLSAQAGLIAGRSSIAREHVAEQGVLSHAVRSMITQRRSSEGRRQTLL